MPARPETRSAGRAVSPHLVTAALVATALALVPLWANDYYLSVGILALTLLLPALGLNLILGYTGMFSLGQTAFFGLGSYVTALLAIHVGWPFWLTFLATGLFCGLVGALLAIPAVHLREDAFAMITLAYVVIMQTIARNWVSLTHGDSGLIGIPVPVIGLWDSGLQIVDVSDFYYLALVVAALGTGFFYWLISSPAGRCMVAIREDETLARSQGVPTWRYKLILFSLSALFAGLGGCIQAYSLTIVTPSVFNVFYTLTLLVIVFGGGAGTFTGVVLGTFLFVALPEGLRFAEGQRMFFYGLILTVLIFRMPEGLGPALAALGRRVGRWWGRSREEVTETEP